MAKSIVYISMVFVVIAFGQSAYAQQPVNKKPQAQVYFFAISDFDKGNLKHNGAVNSIACDISMETCKPSNEYHNGKVVAAVYLGEDKNPDPNYSNIKLTYTFKVYHLSRSNPVNGKLIDSYKLTAKLSQRRIWMILHPNDYGTYTVKVFRRFFKEPIAEGTVVLK